MTCLKDFLFHPDSSAPPAVFPRPHRDITRRRLHISQSKDVELLLIKILKLFSWLCRGDRTDHVRRRRILVSDLGWQRRPSQ